MVDDTKLKQLILYFAARSEAESDPTFGATKLNKLLYFADFLCFRASGQAITGHKYQKLEFGPAPLKILTVLREMREEGLCVEVQRDHYGKPQRRVAALSEPDLSVFTAQEIEIANKVLRDFWGQSAARVSEISHLEIGWRAASLNEEIPYETALIDDPLEPSEEEITFGLELAREYGEQLSNL